MRINFRVPALTFLLFAAVAIPSQAGSFTYQIITDPSATGTRLFGINDHGTVSGDTTNGGAFTYANGVFTDYGNTSDGNGHLAYDTRINNAGDLVGSDGNRAFSLINGIASNIAVPGSSGSTYGAGINNNGVIIGTFDDGPGASGFKLQNGVFSTVHGMRTVNPSGV